MRVKITLLLLCSFGQSGYAQTQNSVQLQDVSTLEQEVKSVAAFSEDRVKEIIAKELEVETKQLTPEAKFIEDLGADSLDIVELVMALEEEFDTEIPDEQAEKIQTVGQAVEYIKAHAKK